MLSKTASIKGRFVARANTNPPIILAHSHANEDIIIPCLSRIRLGGYFSKYFENMIPIIPEIPAGMIKQSMLNSK